MILERGKVVHSSFSTFLFACVFILMRRLGIKHLFSANSSQITFLFPWNTKNLKPWLFSWYHPGWLCVLLCGGSQSSLFDLGQWPVQHVTHVEIQTTEDLAFLDQPPLNCVWCIAIVFFQKETVLLKMFYGTHCQVSYNGIIEHCSLIMYMILFLEISICSQYQKGCTFLRVFVCFGIMLWKLNCVTVQVFPFKMHARKLRSEFETHFPFFITASCIMPFHFIPLCCFLSFSHPVLIHKLFLCFMYLVSHSAFSRSY